MMLKRSLFFILFIHTCLGTLLSQDYVANLEVPNIQMTDINGVEHDLYEQLDQGKVVIVDVFATWCSTCWELHRKALLKSLYRTYGPEGTNQLEIFYIEGDIDTPQEQLYGEQSFGDWTKEVPFPIFSPSEVSSEFVTAFSANGFPTTNVICPSNKENIADVYQNELFKIIEIIQECNTISNVKDLQIISPPTNEVGICNSVDLIFEVLNTGTEFIQAAQMEAVLENGSTFNSHICKVDLSPGSSTKIDLGEFELPDLIESQIINLELLSPDDVASNNINSITYTQAKEVQNELLLKIEPDSWVKMDKTRWWVENSAGDKVIPETNIEAGVIFEEKILLENNDCFTFVIVDDYGDGILLGSISLSTADGTILYDEVNFKERGEANFEYLGTATSTQNLDENAAYNLALQSNIVSTNLSIEFNAPVGERIKISTVNMQGQILSESAMDSNGSLHSIDINVGDYPSGMYFVRLEAESGVISRKFIIE